MKLQVVDCRFIQSGIRKKKLITARCDSLAMLIVFINCDILKAHGFLILY